VTVDEAGALRVLIADQQELLREGIAQLLSVRGFEVTGQAGDAESLLAKVDAYRPDVAVIDLQLGAPERSDGLRAAQSIRGDLPAVAVVLLAQTPTVAGALALIDGDSRGVGYLQKSRAGDTAMLTSALQRVAAGGTAIEPQVATEAIDRAAERGRIDKLSRRERSALRLVLEGRDDAAIGRALRIGPAAVAHHLERVHAALGVEAEPDPGLRAGVLMRLLSDDRRHRPATARASGSGAAGGGSADVLDHERARRGRALVTGFERAQP
jgi:DNA-binding NarL/FixJ family response regulator